MPLLLRIANALAFAGTIATNFLSRAAFNEGKPTPPSSDDLSNAFNSTQSPSAGVWIVPARYAFSIWGLIYTFVLAFVVFQLLPGTFVGGKVRGWDAGAFEVIEGRVSWLFVASCFFNALWLFVFSHNYHLASFFVILFLLSSVGLIWYRVHPYSRNLAYGVLAVDQAEVEPLIGEVADVRARRESLWTRVLVGGTFSLYFGWLVCASTVNFFSVFLPIDPENPSSTLLVSQAALTLLTLLTLFILAKFQDLTFALVVVWALSSMPHNGAIAKYPGAAAERIAMTAEVGAAVVGFGCALLVVLNVAALSRKFVAANRG
ncbi:hypothetical protein HDU67_005404 [Dinochytrium kinnereticum]|nr:hypothetical protein HDU67_005404 [Dinochytrium kinnereticum]